VARGGGRAKIHAGPPIMVCTSRRPMSPCRRLCLFYAPRTRKKRNSWPRVVARPSMGHKSRLLREVAGAFFGSPRQGLVIGKLPPEGLMLPFVNACGETRIRFLYKSLDVASPARLLTAGSAQWGAGPPHLTASHPPIAMAKKGLYAEAGRASTPDEPMAYLLYILLLWRPFAGGQRLKPRASAVERPTWLQRLARREGGPSRSSPAGSTRFFYAPHAARPRTAGPSRPVPQATCAAPSASNPVGCPSPRSARRGSSWRIGTPGPA
jgi:hypothetical protein